MVAASLPHTNRRPTGRHRWPVLAGSVAFHAAVLAAIGLGVIEREERTSPPLPPVYLEMAPRPLLPGETQRPSPPARVIPDQTRPLTASPTDTARQPRRTTDETPDVPTPRVAASPPTGTPAPPAPAERWTYVPESLGAAVGRTLRTGPAGCRTLDGTLTPAEQALCDERFNEAAGRARPIGPRTLTPSETRRQAQFARDGAAALARYEAQRRPLSGGVGVVGPADCIGSNFGTGCAGAHLPSVPNTDMRQGADSLIRQPSNKLE